MPGGGQSKPKVNPWFIAVAVMIATFMEVMDTSIASVAVPYIAGSTASTNDEAEWVLTVYLVANAVFLPASSWLRVNDNFHNRHPLLTMRGVLSFECVAFVTVYSPHHTCMFMAIANSLLQM